MRAQFQQAIVLVSGVVGAEGVAVGTEVVQVAGEDGAAGVDMAVMAEAVGWAGDVAVVMGVMVIRKTEISLKLP